MLCFKKWSEILDALNFIAENAEEKPNRRKLLDYIRQKNLRLKKLTGRLRPHNLKMPLNPKVQKRRLGLT